MYLKQFTLACAAAALLIAPIGAQQAKADGRDFVAGAIIGGILGAAANSQANKQKRVYKTQRTGVSSAQRQQNRDVQTSLNYFGFNVGRVDGSLGRKSRAGISSYQADMGFPATGYLNDYQRDFLVSSYHRSIAGGAVTSQLIAQNPMGVRGLLHTYRNQANGIVQTPTPLVQQPLPATTVVVAPQPVRPQVLSPQPGTTTTTTTVTEVAPNAPKPVVTAAAAGAAAGGLALPSFMGKAEELSLASHCNKVNLVTSTNGGFTTVSTIRDPNMALNEQFCLARTYAITEGEQLGAQIQGYTQAQIAEQCEGFAPAMKDHVAALSLKPVDAVMQDVSSFVLSSGMSPAQLVGTAKICLSVGYRTDNMDVAIGSGLLLTVLGEQVYGELMGHHLAQGFGASKRTDLALAWYDLSLNAIQNGAVPVFNPGQTDRSDLIRKAAYMIGENSQGAVQPQATGALPVFKVAQ